MTKVCDKERTFQTRNLSRIDRIKELMGVLVNCNLRVVVRDKKGFHLLQFRSSLRSDRGMVSSNKIEETYNYNVCVVALHLRTQDCFSSFHRKQFCNLLDFLKFI